MASRFSDAIHLPLMSNNSELQLSVVAHQPGSADVYTLEAVLYQLYGPVHRSSRRIIYVVTLQERLPNKPVRRKVEQMQWLMSAKLHKERLTTLRPHDVAMWLCDGPLDTGRQQQILNQLRKAIKAEIDRNASA